MSGLNHKTENFLDDYTERLINFLEDDLPKGSEYTQRNLILNVLTISLAKFAMNNLKEDRWNKFLKLTMQQLEGTLDVNRKNKG